jgi:hypothetical protein
VQEARRSRRSDPVRRGSYRPAVAGAHLSEHVQQAVERERELVAARLEALRGQSERLHELVAKVDADVAETARLLRRMDEMVGIAPQLSLDAQGELRGGKLQEIAVEFLRQKKGTGVAVHYRDWFDLLVEAVRGFKTPVPPGKQIIPGHESGF